MEEIVIRGPVVKDESEGSFGEILFNRLQRFDNGDEGIMIDFLTKSSISNREILDQSKKLAVALQRFGIKSNDVVAYLSENSLTYFVPVLACFYIGAVINPLNPVYTTRELENAFSVSKPKLVITNGAQLENVLKTNFDTKSIICLDENTFNITTYHDFTNVDNYKGFQPIKIDDYNVGAAILCSSGTTGLPKGVLLSHKILKHGLINLCNKNFVGFAEQDVAIGLVPSFHVFGFLVGLGSICLNFKLILLRKFNPKNFLELIQNYKVTHLMVVPPLALFLAKSPLVMEYDVSSVKDIVCGAAPLALEIINSIKSRFNVTVRQVYGLTESLGVVLIMPHDRPNKIGSVGVPVCNVEVKIIDIDTKQSLGANKSGELCFRAPTQMVEYYNNEAQTKATIDEEGWLHTGDIGYYDDEQYFFIIDRLKELIKYKGFQVPPAELEEILIAHPYIQDAGVIGIPDERAGELPLAFVVLTDNAKLTEKEIVDYVAEHVSIQKQLHGGVRFVSSIPKNTSGKIIRKDLRELIKSI